MLACFSIDNFLQKAEQLKKSHFRPGFDNMTAPAAIMWITVNGERLVHDLYNGIYQPMPAMGFFTAKKDGRYRKLSRLTAIDRIVQSSLLEALSEQCVPRFSVSSCAYISERGLAAALRMFCEYGTQSAFCVKVDPVSCYDNMDHEIMERSLAQFIEDSDTVDLLMKYVRMPVFSEGQLLQRNVGILQGSPISPLLCNIYFHALDMALEGKGVPFVRFADDIVAFADTAEKAQELSDFLINFLKNELHLTPNERKCRITPSAQMVFLGHRFERDRHGMVALQCDVPHEKAYAAWYGSKIESNWKYAQIVSDGILRQKDCTLLFESDTDQCIIPPETTEILNIYSNVVFDSGFLKHALDHRIGINLFDSYGDLIGRFLPNVPLRSPVLTHQQLMAYYDPRQRLKLAKEFLLASIHNLRLNIRYHHKHHPSEKFAAALETIGCIEKAIKACKDYDALLMNEARARGCYYACYDLMIKQPGFVFEKRTRRPPENEFNAMLSFGNTVLYNFVATQILQTALDIQVGFLHATNTRAESLNLDIAEIFKPLIVDRVILRLINKQMITPTLFETQENGGVYLSAEGKRVFLGAFYDKLEDTLTIKDQTLTYKEIITQEIRKLVRFFRTGESYKAFRQVR